MSKVLKAIARRTPGRDAHAGDNLDSLAALARQPSRPDVRGNSYNDLPTWTPAPRRVNPEPPAAIHIGRAPSARATTCAEERAGVLVRAAAATHATSATRICAWPCRRRQTLRSVVANLPPAPHARPSPERPFASARTAQRASRAPSAHMFNIGKRHRRKVKCKAAAMRTIAKKLALRAQANMPKSSNHPAG